MPSMRPLILNAALLFGISCAHAQSVAPSEAEIQIRQADEAFWRSYNACAVDTIGDFFTDDIEFYHDKGGLTRTRAALAESIRKNLCSDPGHRVRREAVPGSVAFYALGADHAILVGEHWFYETQAGKLESREGLAKFTDMWEKSSDGHWRMNRVLSYDHGPVPWHPPTAIMLPAEDLAKFAGRYASRQSGDTVLRVDGDHLEMTSGQLVLPIYAQSAREFFAKERNLQFEFFDLAGKNGKASKRLLIRENGIVMDEAEKQ